MPLFVMATRLNGNGAHSSRCLREKEGALSRAIREARLEVEWVADYVIMGPYDYIDVFRAPDHMTAMQVSALVRDIGYAHTEVWGAMKWHRFKDMLTELPTYSGGIEPPPRRREKALAPYRPQA